MIRILIVIALLLGVLAFATPAEAQRTPRQFLSELVEQAQTLQAAQTKTPEAVDFYALKIIRHNFDIRTMGKFTLGRYWRKATYKQKEKFLELFELVSVKRFGPMLQDLSLDTFRIISINDDDYNNIMIMSTVYSKKKNAEIKIRWRLRSDYFPEYQIIDVTIEGISLMLTLRAEYGEVIKERGVAGLITRLENAIQTN